MYYKTSKSYTFVFLAISDLLLMIQIYRKSRHTGCSKNASRKIEEMNLHGKIMVVEKNRNLNDFHVAGIQSQCFYSIFWPFWI